MFKRKPKPEPSIIASPQAGNVMKNPVEEFAEVYGSALVNSRRMFVVCVLALLFAVATMFALWRVASTKVAIPFMFEVTDATGVVSRPARLEPGIPNGNVIKAELAKWLEQVYTIDSKQTLRLFKEANAHTSGKAVEQFRQFRVEEDIIKRLKEQPDFVRVANVKSVDVSTPGLAYGYVTTLESSGTDAPANPKSYRVTLHYSIVPPTTEAQIYANPLGLYVTFFNAVQERR